VDALVLRVSLATLVVSALAWLAFSAVVILGRLVYDRSRGEDGSKPLSERAARRLIHRVSARPRTEWGRWRRVTALQRLGSARHRSVPGLIRSVLDDPDPLISTAAIRTLGEVGDDWAIEMLVDALRRGRCSRSRVASALEALAPAPAERLLPLLRDRDPVVRFWGATLLQRYPELATATLIELTWDADPNVRAASVETLGTRRGSAAETALVARLDDSAWFVRVHAARAAACVAGVEAAPTIARLLADEHWWVRTAAKDAFRSLGTDAVPVLLSVLGHDDRFARNGAAEVLQDIGFVDFLVLDSPGSQLLSRIYASGGDGYRAAAETRAGALLELESEIEVEEARVA
jgi:HEAT repeat protein